MHVSTKATDASPSEGCWGTIGVSGDRSCTELDAVVHCRNCPVLIRAAEEIFAERAATGEPAAWLESLALTPSPPEATTSVTLFRLGSRWFALATAFVDEVAAMRAVHAVPHRSHTELEGLVNIRGELHLCVRLDDLLKIPERPPDRANRLVVFRHRGESWVFRADLVHGVHSFPDASLTEVPRDLPPAVAVLLRGTFAWEGNPVGYLHTEWLAASLRRSIA